MELKRYSYASNYFEPEFQEFNPTYSSVSSFKGRFLTLLNMLKKLGILPFVLVFKFSKSLLKSIEVLFSFFRVILTGGLSADARRGFSEKLSLLGRDVADWILFPFALSIFLLRHVLGSTLHPGFYWGF